MADHVRQQIRDAAATLISGMTTTGTNVFETRRKAYTSGQLPAWSVESGNETIDGEGAALAGNQRRDFELIFYGLVRELDGGLAQDKLDTMCKELEAQIETGRTFGGLAKDSTLMTTEPEVDDTADQVYGGVEVVYLVTYWTARGVADVAI